MLTLEARYKELCDTPSDIFEHLPTFVETVHELNAAHVIELGTRTGVSTVAWLYALEGTGGRLTSVEIAEKPDIGEWCHWTFVQGDDCDPDVFSELEPADVVFIDTSHAYDQTLKELSLYKWLVRPGGRILLHDTELMHPEFVHGRPFPVRRAIETFCAAEGLEWTNDERCWGLGRVDL